MQNKAEMPKGQKKEFVNDFPTGKLTQTESQLNKAVNNKGTAMLRAAQSGKPSSSKV